MRMEQPLSTFINWLRRRGEMFAEKKLSGHNDRERRNKHHCKRQCDQPYARLTSQGPYLAGLCRAR
jgi:hypothetical protein